MLGVVDSECTMMALHLYIGLIKVVPLRLDSGDELKAFNCRLEDLYAIDVQFLHGCEQPSIAYLAQASSERRWVGDGGRGGREGIEGDFSAGVKGRGCEREEVREREGGRKGEGGKERERGKERVGVSEGGHNIFSVGGEEVKVWVVRERREGKGGGERELSGVSMYAI